MSLWQIAVMIVLVISAGYIMYYWCKSPANPSNRRRRNNRQVIQSQGPSVYTIDVDDENQESNNDVVNSATDLPPSYDEVMKQRMQSSPNNASESEDGIPKISNSEVT